MGTTASSNSSTASTSTTSSTATNAAVVGDNDNDLLAVDGAQIAEPMFEPSHPTNHNSGSNSGLLSPSKSASVSGSGGVSYLSGGMALVPGDRMDFGDDRLSSLNDELLLRVLVKLDEKSVCRFDCLSRRLRRVANSDRLWQQFHSIFSPFFLFHFRYESVLICFVLFFV